jgi:acyl-CoA thioesterase-2
MASTPGDAPEAPAVDLWPDLLGCLELSPVAGDPACLEGPNLRLRYHRLFGGQLLAQFVRAASLTCPGKTVKSLHVLFTREGQSQEPVRYETERQHEGKTFAALTILARQARGVIATAAVSMHAAEDGLSQQSVAPAGSVPGPEHHVDLSLLPWDTRSDADLDAREPAPPEFSLWMRPPPVDHGLVPAVVAYATDLTLIGTALRPLAGISQRDAQQAFTSAVTSHTVWFHRPGRAGGWLLLRQHSPVLAHGRCFGRGDVVAEDGTLVASYAQEAMLRFRP